MEFLLKIVFIIIGVLVLTNAQNDNLKYVLYGVVITLMLDIVRLVALFISKNCSNLLSVIKSLTIYRNKRIRLSCAYLYKIKVGDKYLLVKNSHRESYQPVGGVFKRNEDSSQFLNSIEFGEDEKLTNRKTCSKDLRIHIKGKQLCRYLNWYNKNKDREISYTREFYEELVAPGLLSKENFPYPIFSFRKRISTSLKWSRPFQYYELLIYDILELTPNEIQTKELEDLQKKGDTNYIKWADSETIRGIGYSSDNRKANYEIGDQTVLLIDMEYSKKYML